VGVATIGGAGDDRRAGLSTARVLDVALAEPVVVLPGITGLRQLRGRSRSTMRETLHFDVECVRRRTTLVDLLIPVRTDGCLLRREAV
jgi:lipopolysaccharide/colanic/teichoic acid biosynthesis glycosyltransferase